MLTNLSILFQGNLEDGKGTPPAVQSQAAQMPSSKKPMESSPI